eukprot:TRINITY_DN6364_c0_g1_i1.p1 TRINITY_DN6364_c0_g1~~TRINITY_DN6364_c0_g1_i1.p1  ORF type:complete len:122 (+),score=16.51 TRINITY_DN6364_c0_g1_i1:52-366(+)
MSPLQSQPFILKHCIDLTGPDCPLPFRKSNRPFFESQVVISPSEGIDYLESDGIISSPESPLLFSLAPPLTNSKNRDQLNHQLQNEEFWSDDDDFILENALLGG